MLLESLSLLLAVVSISYLSAVYRPTDEVRNESGPLRQLVKIACDAEVRDVDQGRVEEEEPEWHTWPHDLLRRRTKKKENGSNNVSLWKRFRHFVGVFFEDEMPAVEIRTPALGAKSSHVEFTPPEETSVTHVFAGIDNKLTEAGGIVEIMDQDYGKTILTFNDTQGKKASATTAGCDRETVIARMSDADETATEEKSAQFKRPLGIGESKYRVSQTSAHIQISPDRAFETLLVRLIPNNIRTLKAAHLATWLSILTTLLLLIRQGVEAPKANDAKFDPWLTFEGLITLLALLVAIFTALAFSAGQHLVARKIWAPTLNLFRSYLIIATLTPLVLIPGLIRPDFAYQSFLKYKVWLFHMPVYTLVALMLIAVGTLFLEASYRNYLNLHQHTEQNFYGEFVVQDSFDKRFRRRPEQNVVNPTETGPYDCRYLNFEYLSLGGPPLTARKYVSALSGNIRDTFEPKGQ